MTYKDTNKYFLTGFTLVGTLALFLLTLAMMVGIQLYLVIINVNTMLLVLATLAIAIITSFFYRNSKKDLLDSEDYSRIVVNYIRTTISLSVSVIALFSSIAYVLMMLIRSLDGIFVPFIIAFLLILSLYIEGLSLLTLFISCCSLRDIDRYHKSILYVLILLVLLIVGYGISKYLMINIIPIIFVYYIGASVLVTIYMVNGLKLMLEENEVETLADRYKFVTQALAYTITAPINIPVQIVLKITKVFKKEEKHERI